MSGEKKSLFGSFKTKSFKAGSYSLILCAVALVIVILLNLIFSALPTKLTELDISSNDLYSLSEYSKTVAKGIKEDVTIYQLSPAGHKDETISRLLARYEDLNKHIKVEVRDPEISQIATAYTKDEVSANSLIFVTEKRSKVVDANSIYGYSQDAMMASYYGQQVSPDEFSGEQEITSALSFVTSDVLPKAYTLSGHGEFELPSAVQSSVASQNIELAELDLMIEKDVPDDCACLLIMAPDSDLREEECKAIEAYAEKGGNVMISTLVANMLKDKTPNFDKLVAYYGVDVQDSFVIEGDPSHYNLYPSFLLPDVESHEITDPIVESKYHVFMPMARALQESKNYRSSLSLSPLLTTSDDAFSRVDTQNPSAEKSPGDGDGPFTLAFAASETVGTEETRAVILASPFFLDEQFVGYTGNMNLLLNALKWMCQLEDNISVVETKSLSTGGTLEVDASSANLLSIVIIFVLPAALLAAGIVIFVRRKKR